MQNMHLLLFLFLFNLAVVSPVPIKIDCHPDKNPTAASCVNRGCLWIASKPPVPSCVFDPAKMPGYDAKKSDLDHYILTRRATPTLFQNDFQQLKFNSEAITKSILRVKISPIGFQKSSNNKKPITNPPDFTLKIQTSPFGFSVSRNDTQEDPIFDTVGIPGFTFSKQFILFTTRVSTRNLYGIGEQWHQELRRDFNWKRYSLLTHDHAPVPDMNLYSHQPFYMGLDKSNRSYGIYLHNTHPMDYLIQPNPDLLSFRMIGGDIDLYFFMGPSSDDVIAQYTSLIGRPMMPPYWALGFQLSRFGYKSVADLKKVWDRNRAARIPQDVQVIDIDYADGRKDFTYDPVRFKDLPDFIRNTIHATNRKLVLITDPGIASRPPNPYKPLELGLKMDIFIKDNRTKKPLEGSVWPGNTYWPDFSHPKATKYWSTLMSTFHKTIEFDGIWLDMNDPSNFVPGSLTNCSNNSLNFPPFSPVSYEPFYTMTICLDSLQYLGSHYEWHNYYGHHEIITTYKALDTVFPGQRPHILSRSTSPGSGVYAAHWTGDNYANWKSLNQSIVAMLEFNMFGIPFTGTDICGFGSNTNEELCLRWSQLGAFYPYCRNHNCLYCRDQDPAVWGGKTTESIREALEIRYSLLPYMYTLFYDANLHGTTVMKPLFFEFANDSNTWNLHEQFLFGPSLMITPILEKNKTSKNIYVPRGMWYNVLANYEAITGPKIDYKLSISNIGILLREKSIIPIQKNLKYGNSSTEWRKNPFGLVVSVSDGSKGKLFWDDGVSKNSIPTGKYCLIIFQCDSNKTNGFLEIRAKSFGCEKMPKLEYAFFAGMSNLPAEMTLDGKPIDKKLMILKGNSVFLYGQNITMDRNETSVIAWKI